MAIMELVTEEVFDRKEISQENAIGIAKSFLKIKSIFDKIKDARIRGDYAFEQQFFITESEQYPINIDGKNQIDRNEDKKILLSELIDKYSKAQIQDGKWKEHMLSEHISVLNNITEILGD